MLSITYLSSATKLMTTDELTDLLFTVRVKNRLAAITGVLLYSGGNFVQTIEGPDDAVLALYDRIALDSRHGSILEAWREPIEERTFPAWTMGFREVGREELAAIPGLNDYLSGHEPLVPAGGPKFTAEVFYCVFRDGMR